MAKNDKNKYNKIIGATIIFILTTSFAINLHSLFFHYQYSIPHLDKLSYNVSELMSSYFENRDFHKTKVGYRASATDQTHKAIKEFYKNNKLVFGRRVIIFYHINFIVF